MNGIFIPVNDNTLTTTTTTTEKTEKKNFLLRFCSDIIKKHSMYPPHLEDLWHKKPKLTNTNNNSNNNV
jgi:hypothetical protein